MNPVKILITSKANLQFKYGKSYQEIADLLKKLEEADKKRQIDTKTVFIDDAKSARAAGIKAVSSVTAKECKRAVDELYKKHVPAYIVIVGAQDVIPFQEINNPVEDDDPVVPSDLPYACDALYSKDVAAFTGPTRVVGRIPDIPGKQNNAAYFKILIENSIKHKTISPDSYRKYFSVSAQVWKKSTELSLQSMFSDTSKLIISPSGNQPSSAKYTTAQLRALTHFYNCHGALSDPSYYGQKGNNYPVAMHASYIGKKISPGTVVAAECCYGAELFDSTLLQPQSISIANTYMENNAIAFLGSTTIAYGPADSQGLADLITQYFIKSILNGASAGRALLEARQRFLTASGPQLDPYELKTLAQFNLLGDPSLHPAFRDDGGNQKTLAGNTTENNRINLFSKGVNLRNTIQASKKQNTTIKSSDKRQLNEILINTNFKDVKNETVYKVESKRKSGTALEKKLGGSNARFRTFIKPGKKDTVHDIKVLVVKENDEQILGWRVYESR